METELLEQPTTALTVTARAALALSSDKTRKELKELVAKSANIKEVKNAAGREECHAAAMVLLRARTTIAKTGKAAREDAAAFQKAVIAEEKSLIAITEAEESRLMGLRDAWDAARAAEKAEAERIERERVAKIHLRIADIRETGNLALQARTSAMVESLIDKLDGATLDGFDEFAEEAERARETTLARMKEIGETKRAEEQERARIKAEQEAEAVRLAAERAENARIAAEAKAEQDKRDAEAKALREKEEQRLAAERAELERLRAEAQEAQDKRDEEARSQREAEAAELERQRREIAAENERISRERAELEAAKAPKPEPEPEPQAEPPAQQEEARDIGDDEIAATAILAICEKFGMEWDAAVDRLQAIEDWSTADVPF